MNDNMHMALNISLICQITPMICYFMLKCSNGIFAFLVCGGCMCGCMCFGIYLAISHKEMIYVLQTYLVGWF